MNCLLIGRHKLLPAQEKDIVALGCDEIERIEHVNDINQVLSLDADAIIVQALPLPLMMQLVAKVSKPVYFLKMEGKGLAEEEEARRFLAQAPDRRVILPPPPNSGEKKYRLMEYVGVFREKRVIIEEEPVILHEEKRELVKI